MSAAERQRRRRERRAAGIRELRIDVDEVALADALVRAGYLSLTQADCPQAMGRAVEVLLARLVALVPCDAGGSPDVPG